MKLRRFALGTTLLGLVAAFFGSLPALDLGFKLTLLTISVPALLLSVVLWLAVFINWLSNRKHHG